MLRVSQGEILNFVAEITDDKGNQYQLPNENCYYFFRACIFSLPMEGMQIDAISNTPEFNINTGDLIPEKYVFDFGIHFDNGEETTLISSGSKYDLINQLNTLYINRKL